MRYTIECSDGKVELGETMGDAKTRDVLKQSALIWQMMMDENDDVDIPLPNINRRIFSRIMDFLVDNVNNPMPKLNRPIKSANMKENTVTWAADYIDSFDKDHDFLFDVILGANYLDVDSLLDLGCAKLASMLKTRTPKEIRELFNLREPTVEEEDRVRQDNQWIFDLKPVALT